MHFEGVVKKMTTELYSEVNYFIEFQNSFIHLNQFLEKLKIKEMKTDSPIEYFIFTPPAIPMVINANNNDNS